MKLMNSIECLVVLIRNSCASNNSLSLQTIYSRFPLTELANEVSGARLGRCNQEGERLTDSSGNTKRLGVSGWH